ncbi:expressed unknown protein [Seminavis robusta]|uniref:DUF5898 domain-containing protein n=1 Tax=Seminavis robusta TaxID=568900 RepID=A0A9N8HWH8_9STRA|nr:expressed unknown protein [Seminavis robusta]|eukprot:Sro2659_g333920.1 n/a (632) ;mRNA; f:6091-7986
MSLEVQGPAPATKKLKTSSPFEELLQKAKSLGMEFSKGALNGMNEKDLSSFIHLAEENKRQAEENKRQAEALAQHSEYSMSCLIKNTPEMALRSVGTENSHTGKSKHVEATSKQHKMNLESFDKVDKFPFHEPSSLLVKFRKNARKAQNTNHLVGSYHSESDVSGWITASLEDAQQLAQAATGRTFHVHHEFSLWSDRPDHLVLYDKARQDPIIAVEDKKPFRDGKKMTNHVRGQMFDYLMELRCLGHSAPFAVLSTFEESWLFWQDDEESNKIVESKDRLTEVKDKLGTDAISPTKLVAAEKKTPSPPELKNEVGTANDNTGTDSDLQSTFDACSRDKLLQTEVYSSKQLVPLLYTAIICGLARNPTAPRENYSSVRKSYDGIALQLNKSKYNWGHLRLSVGSPITFQGRGSSTRRTNRGPCSEGSFFAIEKLGRGDTSKVFDAYDHSGKRCAIKMYIKRGNVKRGNDENEKLQSLQDSKATGTDSCKREAKRLLEFYPFLQDEVYFEELNTFPCVVMPFFRPLSKEERQKFRSDEKLGKQVSGCLSALAKKGLKYHESDLRWRHIGYYDGGGDTGEKLVMFDLADLEEMEDTEKKKPGAFVVSQIDYLFKRLPDSEPEGQTETNGVQDA